MTQAVLTDFAALKPEVYGPMAQTMLAQYIDWVMAGAADRVALPAGPFVPFPGFKQLSGDMDIMVDDGTYDINKIDPKKDIAVVCHRIKNFGADDLVKIVTGMDASSEISKQLATYFGKQISSYMLSVLKGAFSSTGPLYTSNRYTVYADDATVANQFPLTPQVAALGMAKIGDEMNNIAAFLVHSVTAAKLLAAGYVSTSTGEQPWDISPNGEILRFMGRPLIVRDTLPTTAGTHATMYRTYAVARGALAYGVQKDLNPEPGRNSEKKMDFIATDIHFAPHIRGIKWNVTTENPTVAQLETGTNWALSEEDAKFVRVVAIEHN